MLRRHPPLVQDACQTYNSLCRVPATQFSTNAIGRRLSDMLCHTRAEPYVKDSGAPQTRGPFRAYNALPQAVTDGHGHCGSTCGPKAHAPTGCARRHGRPGPQRAPCEHSYQSMQAGGARRAEGRGNGRSAQTLGPRSLDPGTPVRRARRTKSRRLGPHAAHEATCPTPDARSGAVIGG